MSEKLPFSPYPPQARAHVPTVRRSRRRLLPFILIGIVVLIYFTRTPRYENPARQIADQAPQAGSGDASQGKTHTVEPSDHSTVEDMKENMQSQASAMDMEASTSQPIPTKEEEHELNDAEETKPTQKQSLASSAVSSAVSSADAASDTSSPKPIAHNNHGASNTTKVTLDAHIMSKCPDARDCLRDMVVPAMEQVSELVSFNLSFVQTLKPDGSVECKHGPAECLGDTLILCAQNLYPNSTVRSLGFANCMVSNYRDIPARAHVENCALEHGVNFDALNECASDTDRGERLLQEAARWSRDEGVKYSCTVRVAGETWCVRDGGEWKECDGGSKVDDLVAKIKKLAVASEEKTKEPSAVEESSTQPIPTSLKSTHEEAATLTNSTKASSQDTGNLADLGQA